MTTVRVETLIHAPPELCFDLTRDVHVHNETAAFTQERVLTDHPTGLLELGDMVTFEARHLGVRQRLTARITEFDRPHRFVDEVEESIFRSLRHQHLFQAVKEGTLMTDVIEFRTSIWALGVLSERLVVGPHLRRFLKRRNQALKEIAEARHGGDPPFV